MGESISFLGFERGDGFGGGMSVYEGITHLTHPTALKSAFGAYIVVGSAFLFEGTSLVFALKKIWKLNGQKPFWQALRESTDPGLYTVMPRIQRRSRVWPSRLSGYCRPK